MLPIQGIQRAGAQNRRFGSGVLASLAIGALLGFFLVIPAQAANAADSTATVTGTVVLGTKPMPNLDVTLVALSSSQPQSATVKSDSNGRFSFTGLVTGSVVTYTITAKYKDATFYGEGLTLTAGEVRSITLNVYPATVSAAAVKLSAWTVWLDFTGGKLAVQQDVSFTNVGSAAYTGTVPVTADNGAGLAAVMLPIAAGATKFEYLGRFQSCCSTANATTWAHVSPIAPGTTQGTVRYQTSPIDTLSFPAQFPVTTFAILVPKGSHISSPQLHAAGTETDQGVTYEVYRGGPLAAGAIVTIAVGAPPKSIEPVTWIAAVLVLLLVVLLGWLAYRRRNRRKSTGSAQSTPAARIAVPKAAVGAAHPRGNARPNPAVSRSGSAAQIPKRAPSNGLSEVGRRSDPAELADELARLDLAFEKGSLTDEASYRMIREALVQKLIAAVSADPTKLR